jgi:hypothetical protein
MTTKFSMIKDINGLNGFGLEFSDTKYNIKLAASTEKNFDIPHEHEKYLAVFSYEPGDPVWVARNETAALPGTSFAPATSELLPTARVVKRDDVLSFITSEADVEVGVALYAL